MIIQMLTWNMKGFQASLKQFEGKELIRKMNIKILYLIKTRIQKLNSSDVVDKICYGWNFIHNNNDARLGRIWALWKGSF